MRVYEEYGSIAEKRQAQKGAQRGKATGMARGYILVFPEDGWAAPDRPVLNAIGSIYHLEPGDGPRGISHNMPHIDYLHERCRRIGFDALPEEWQRAFVIDLYRRVVPTEERDHPQNRHIMRLIRHKNRELNLGLEMKQTA